jgi:FG-GAP repeat
MRHLLILSGTLAVLQPAAAQVTNFVLAATPRVVAGPMSVAVADVNGDGQPDLVTENTFEGTLMVLTDNGSGGFGLNVALNVGSYPVAVVAADVNGDRRLDLITANFDADNLSVLFNVPCLDLSTQTHGEMQVWPYPSSGFVLQQTANPGTAHRVDVTNNVNFIGGQNQMILPVPAGNDFFRLTHP